MPPERAEAIAAVARAAAERHNRPDKKGYDTHGFIDAPPAPLLPLHARR